MAELPPRPRDTATAKRLEVLNRLLQDLATLTDVEKVSILAAAAEFYNLSLTVEND